MQSYYLAIDIGASSGRHILGSLQDGKIVLEEMHRFPNGQAKKNGHLCWDFEALFREILIGLKKCADAGKIPVSMGIDTWGVDFVLLDQNDQVLGDTVGYRDSRTNGMDQKVFEVFPEEELYARTGIQRQIFNTIYQLRAVKEEHPAYLQQAKTMLFVPDYLHFLLTGKKTTEFTIASTSQLLKAGKQAWDLELFEKLGLPTDMLCDIQMPGTVLGGFTDMVKKEVGFDCQVILPASHDTASAVMSVPANGDDHIYISSGTWSLMGIELPTANCSLQAMQEGFTNEGAYNGGVRFLKNIMGLWMIQSIKKELNDEFSFPELSALAKENAHFPSRVDADSDVFLAPERMITAVQDYCRNSGQPVPQTPGELSMTVLGSLAQSYAKAVKGLEAITGKTFNAIHIVGGGCNNLFLNELTAEATGKTVYAGPTEATALGNILVQMLQKGDFSSLQAARAAIYDSFGVKKF